MGDATNVALINAGAQMASTGATAYAQGKLNKKTREWNEAMYARTRQDNLADWAMQNEYNSPKAQMQRFRDAGLNPALIYGQTNTAEAVKSAPSGNWSPRAPSYEGIGQGVASGLQAYYDIKLKEASLDNLTARNTVLVQEAALKEANVVNTLSRTAKTDFELALASELRETSLEAANENLRKLRIQNQYTLNEDERRAISNATSIQEAGVRILGMKLSQTKVPTEIAHIKAQIENLKKDNQIKQLDYELKKSGADKSPWWLQMVTRVLNENGYTPSGLIKEWFIPKKQLTPKEREGFWLPNGKINPNWKRTR